MNDAKYTNLLDLIFKKQRIIWKLILIKERKVATSEEITILLLFLTYRYVVKKWHFAKEKVDNFYSFFFQNASL